MTDAERTGLDHVVLPRRRPGLAILERHRPSPADNILDAELAAFAASGDTVLDPWAGTGSVARRAVGHGMRAVAADASPFSQLAAIALLNAPDPSVLDAAFAQLAGSRRVDVPLRQHIEELYASRYAACRRPIVVDQFIWPRDGDAPGRKIYRCASCDASIGGPEERVAPVDEVDLAKLGIERVERLPIAIADEAEELPPAPVGLTEIDEASEVDEEGEAPLGEAGGPPEPPSPAVDPPSGLGDRPRFASTVRPDPILVGTAEGIRHSPQYLELRARFPVLDGRDELVTELLDLYTPRNLYALHAIGSKIDSELRDVGSAAAMRLALAACLLPASRLNGYPGRVASLRIAGGHVRQPASRYQREANVWRLFETAVDDVRTAVAALGRDRRPARFAPGLEELGGMGADNVLWIRCRPAVIGQYLPADHADMVLSSIATAPSVDELSFEYLATSWLIGREAAETLRLEPLFGSSPAHSDGAEATALRHAMVSAAGALKPDGWFVVMLEGDDPDRLLAAAAAGAAAALELVDVIHRQ